MAVTLNSNGITFSDGNSQNSAATGGVTFGPDQYSGFATIATSDPRRNANGSINLPSNSVVVGMTISTTATPRGPRTYDRIYNQRFKYKNLS